MPAVVPVPLNDLGDALAAMPPDELARFLASCNPDDFALAEEALGTLGGADRYFPDAREKQQIPTEPGWLIWLLMAGRGFGKTVTGAEWIVERASTQVGDWGVVAPTITAGRSVCFEGRGDEGKPSGVISVLERRGWRYVERMPPEPDASARIYTYNRSDHELRMANGSMIRLFTAEKPNRIRGPNLSGAWADEIGAWEQGAVEAWNNLIFALRVSEYPQVVATTTPRPVPLVRSIVDRKRQGDDSIVLVKGATSENIENLSVAAVEEMQNRYAGTRIGRQELEGELLDDVQGALWRAEDVLHLQEIPRLERIMVGIDPSTWGEDITDQQYDSVGKGVETGLIAAGIMVEGDPKGRIQIAVLEDLSGRYSTEEWARKACGMWRRWSQLAPTWLVPEVNLGGWVTSTLRLIDPHARIFSEKGKAGVRASQAKRARAEPVAALYEQQRAYHVGYLEILEDQMVTWDARENWSPDRIDALVWAVTALKPWSGVAAIAPAPDRRPQRPKPSVRATNLGNPQRVGRPRSRGNSSLR